MSWEHPTLEEAKERGFDPGDTQDLRREPMSLEERIAFAATPLGSALLEATQEQRRRELAWINESWEQPA